MTNTAVPAPTFEKSPEIQRWMRDGYHAAVRSRNRAYVMCLFLLLVAAAAVFSVSALAPLKEVKTNIVLVDAVHGVVTSVQDGADLQELTAKYAITQAMLYRYVIARESYDPADYQVKYDLVRKMSTRQPREEYEARMASKSSPIQVLGHNGRRTVRIQSVNQLTPETSQVRFVVSDTYDGKANGAPKHWIAIVSHKYLSTPPRISCANRRSDTHVTLCTKQSGESGANQGVVGVVGAARQFDFGFAIAVRKGAGGLHAFFIAGDAKTGKAAFAGKAAGVAQKDHARFAFAAGDQRALLQFKAHVFFIKRHGANRPVGRGGVVNHPGGERAHEQFGFQQTIGCQTDGGNGASDGHAVVFELLPRMRGTGGKQHAGGKRQKMAAKNSHDIPLLHMRDVIAWYASRQKNSGGKTGCFAPLFRRFSHTHLPQLR